MNDHRSELRLRAARPLLGRAAAIAVAALSASRAGAAAVDDARAEEDRRVFAEALFSRGLYKQAAAEFARFAEDYPDSPDAARAAFRLGESLRLCGDREGALRAYRRAAEAPGSEFREKALFKRAAIFADLGRHEAADELLAELLRENGLSAEVRELALYYHASSLEALGRGAEAEARLESLLSEFPGSEMASYARLSLARLCSAPGPDGAPPSPARLGRARSLLRALAEAPASPRLGAEALYLLAFAEKASGDDAAAADAFADLFARYPDDRRVAESRLPAAWVLCRAQRLREALECADAALAADPPPEPRAEAEARYVRAQALFRLARYAESAEGFARAAESRGADAALAARARYQQALSLFKCGEFARALEASGPVLDDDEMRADALWLRAEAAARLADAPGAAETEATAARDTAIESLRRLSAEFPGRESDDDVLYRLGESLRARGAFADAAAAFHELLSRHPGSKLAPQARFAAASSLSAAGRGAEALADWQTCVRDYPDAPGAVEALFQAAVELLRLGRKNEALSGFSALAKRPDGGGARRADALYWSGVLLSDAGEPAEAERALDAALAADPEGRLSAEIRFARAEALRAAGKDAEASAAYAALLDGGAPAARFTPGLLGWIATRQCEGGDFAAAAATARRMAEAAGDDPAALQTAWTLVGRAERAASRAREAEEAYQKAHDQPVATESAPEAALRLAQLKLARGDAAGALPCFREAVELCAAPELRPWRVWAYIGLGRASLALGDEDAAARYLSTVCLLYRDPEILPPVFDETIRLLVSLGRTEEADALRETKARDYPEAR